MNPIQLFGQATKSRNPVVSSQKRVNMYLEQNDDKTQLVAYGTPGTVLSHNLGFDSVRGWQEIVGNLYAVHGESFVEINGTTVTSLGTLGTASGRVSIANNGIQMMIVDGAYGYIYTFATGSFVKITDADYPKTCDTVTFLDGYFIVNKSGTGQFFISKLYDGLVWNALDFATAESNPDNLRVVFSDHGQLMLLSRLSTEFWVNTGEVDFPFSRISQVTAEFGIAANWSITKFAGSVVWLARNREGGVQVVKMSGSSPESIMTPDISAIFDSYTTVKDATGFSYTHNGHPFYQINFPTEGESWLYDGSMGLWSQLRSYNLTRQRFDLSVNFLDKTYFADFNNGKIYKLDDSIYTENGHPIESELISKHVFNGLSRFSIQALQVDIETGVGLSTGQGSDPQIMLQISKDGGHTWGNERWATMGKIGEYKSRARWLRLGQARDWVFKLRISDPVKRVILGAYIIGS
ncbi:MAG: hypothetical protein WC756_21240 [Taibaiella sp.]|jgi:hypothetical protein